MGEHEFMASLFWAPRRKELPRVPPAFQLGSGGFDDSFPMLFTFTVTIQRLYFNKAGGCVMRVVSMIFRFSNFFPAITDAPAG